jgi:hypothetical protein
MKWEHFRRHVDRWIPHPEVLHEYSNVRFYARQPE